ncbi:hypothetical protein SUGI_0480520 [Cryptomeria japonica]|nr:hypothetical protein SUGI_0480520 [Cryptomeria japonica]
MSTMEFLRQIIVCGLVFLLAVAGSIAQDVAIQDMKAKHEPNIDGYEVNIAESLLNVMDFLQKAHNTSSYVEQCRLSIETALDSTPWVQTLVLNNSYYPAIKRLDTIRDTLFNCSELYLPEDIYVPEALVDFAHQASKHVDKTTALIGDLQHLWKQTYKDIFDTSEYSNQSQPFFFQARGSCVSDGTKCPYTRCGAGKRLPRCAIGFARGVTGGLNGISYTVISNEDYPDKPKPGTLRYGVEIARSHRHGVWITFSHDMIITLRKQMWVYSHTTIDGRGARVILTGKPMILPEARNVILHNFQISGVRESDTIHIFSGTRQVWVDHVTSFDAKLGLVSVVQGATDVTISNCHLSNKNFNMLLGASDNDVIDQKLRVTVYRNWFKDSRQRMPHCRWGYCHVVNNYYTNWEYYAIGGRVHAKVYSESNVFYSGKRREITPWYHSHGPSFDTTSAIQSINDLFLNGATFHQFLDYGKLNRPRYRHHAKYPPVLSTSKVANLVKTCSGALHGRWVNACKRLR